MESFFAEFEANPAPNVTGKLSLNVLGNVPIIQSMKYFMKIEEDPNFINNG